MRRFLQTYVFLLFVYSSCCSLCLIFACVRRRSIVQLIYISAIILHFVFTALSQKDGSVRRYAVSGENLQFFVNTLTFFLQFWHRLSVHIVLFLISFPVHFLSIRLGFFKRCSYYFYFVTLLHLIHQQLTDIPTRQQWVGPIDQML